MEGFLQVKLSKHQVALAGKVFDALTETPIASALVTIKAAPEAFQRLLALRGKQNGAAPAEARPDRAQTAHDGCFAFINLPDGAYKLAIEGPQGSYYGAVEKDLVVKRDAGGVIAASITPIPLHPTGARGTVKAKDSLLPLSLAHVRAEGEEASAYCDASGNFLLLGVPPGARRLSIRATGFVRAAIAAPVALGKLVDVGTILLEPNGA